MAVALCRLSNNPPARLSDHGKSWSTLDGITRRLQHSPPARRRRQPRAWWVTGTDAIGRLSPAPGSGAKCDLILSRVRHRGPRCRQPAYSVTASAPTRPRRAAASAAIAFAASSAIRVSDASTPAAIRRRCFGDTDTDAFGLDFTARWASSLRGLRVCGPEYGPRPVGHHRVDWWIISLRRSRSKC